jgi:hypothetical protein
MASETRWEIILLSNSMKIYHFSYITCGIQQVGKIVEPRRIVVDRFHCACQKHIVIVEGDQHLMLLTFTVTYL